MYNVYNKKRSLIIITQVNMFIEGIFNRRLNLTAMTPFLILLWNFQEEKDRFFNI